MQVQAYNCKCTWAPSSPHPSLYRNEHTIIRFHSHAYTPVFYPHALRVLPCFICRITDVPSLVVLLLRATGFIVLSASAALGSEQVTAEKEKDESIKQMDDTFVTTWIKIIGEIPQSCFQTDPPVVVTDFLLFTFFITSAVSLTLHTSPLPFQTGNRLRPSLWPMWSIGKKSRCHFNNIC